MPFSRLALLVPIALAAVALAGHDVVPHATKRSINIGLGPLVCPENLLVIAPKIGIGCACQASFNAVSISAWFRDQC